MGGFSSVIKNYNAIAQIVNQTNSKRNSQKEKWSPFASGNWVFDWGTKVAWRLPLVWRWGRSQLMSVWRPVGLEWGQNSLQKQWLAYQSEIVFFWLILWMHFTSTMITSLFIWVYSTYQYMIWVWVFSNQRDVTTNHESNINSPFINCKSVHLNVTGRPTISFLILLVHIDLFGIATPVVPKPGVPGSRNNQFGSIDVNCTITKPRKSVLLFYYLKK